MIRYFMEHITPNSYWHEAFLYSLDKRLARHIVDKKHSGTWQYYDFNRSKWVNRKYPRDLMGTLSTLSEKEANKYILARKLCK